MSILNWVFCLQSCPNLFLRPIQLPKSPLLPFHTSHLGYSICIKKCSQLSIHRNLNFMFRRLCTIFYRQRKTFNGWGPFWVIDRELDEGQTWWVRLIFDRFRVRWCWDESSRCWSRRGERFFCLRIGVGRGVDYGNWIGICWRRDGAWIWGRRGICWCEQSTCRLERGTGHWMRQRQANWGGPGRVGFWSWV